jgi:uncharacterized repeat protein (TIGR03803 family)
MVFKLSPPKQKGGAWTETVLYSFKGGNDGYVPNGDLTVDNAGNLYGATLFGGGKGAGLCDPFYQGCGTVYKLTRPTQKGGKWTEKVLHSFAAGTDGYNPNGGLLLNSKGAIYGTTPMGGNQQCNYGNYKVGCGIAYKLIPPAKMGEAWAEKVLYCFTDGNDGAGPNGGMIFDTNGSLYGTEQGGSNKGPGAVYRLTYAGNGRWTYGMLYDLPNNWQKGAGPLAGVVRDASGNLYGTASEGGTARGGTVFRLSSSGSFTVLHDFSGDPDGAYPAARLTFDKAGNLYSTTSLGGAAQSCQGGCGTVFEVWP